LWDGRLIDATDTELATSTIRTLNEKIHHDERVSISMLPVGDGLTIIRKRD